MSQNKNFTTTQIIQKCKFHQNANVTKRPMSPRGQCHQNANITKTQISPLELTFVFLHLPNGFGKIRSPDLVHINPNGLQGHGLSDSRPCCICRNYLHTPRDSLSPVCRIFSSGRTSCFALKKGFL